MTHGPRCGCDDERCDLKRQALKRVNGKTVRQAALKVRKTLIETRAVRLEDLEDIPIEVDAET